MTANTERVHIGLDDADFEQTFIEATRRPGRFDTWNLVAGAEPGDLVVVYLQEDLCSFVGTCVVDSFSIPKPPDKKEQRLKTWYHVRDAELLPEGYVHVRDFEELFGDEWRFHGRPGVTCVPRDDISRDLVDEFLELLYLRPQRHADVGVPEGLDSEARYLRKSRNRGFRNKVLRQAKGICEACLKNYSKVLNGLGRKCLHVHHRNQLALNDEPVVTCAEDLAVVCANCHMIIHADPKKAMKVEALRDLISADKATTPS